MYKDIRQKRILSLIQAKRIGTQQELTGQLRRAGLNATQSSVSRDLLDLGIVKQRGHYTLPHASSGSAARGLLGLEMAGESLIVAKCEAGLASSVALEIDRARIPEVVGSLAGEDTVFVAVSERRAQRTAIKKIWELFE
jgi:transcriptional regulator of arginine metabolism